jgi:hypothetical protein
MNANAREEWGRGRPGGGGGGDTPPLTFEARRGHIAASIV